METMLIKSESFDIFQQSCIWSFRDSCDLKDFSEQDVILVNNDFVSGYDEVKLILNDKTLRDGTEHYLEVVFNIEEHDSLLSRLVLKSKQSFKL